MQVALLEHSKEKEGEKMKKTYKIYEGNTLQEAMDKLLADGARPAFKTLRQAWRWKRQNSLYSWIEAGLYFQFGFIKPLTIAQCENLQKLYDRGGRLLFLGSDLNLGLSVMGGIGRFVGVKLRRKKQNATH